MPKVRFRGTSWLRLGRVFCSEMVSNVTVFKLSAIARGAGVCSSHSTVFQGLAQPDLRALKRRLDVHHAAADAQGNPPLLESCLPQSFADDLSQENPGFFGFSRFRGRPSSSFRCVFVRNFYRRIQRTSRDEVGKIRNRQYFFRTETRGDEERGLLEKPKNPGFSWTLVCPLSLSDYFRMVLDRLRGHFAQNAVLDDPCAARKLCILYTQTPRPTLLAAQLQRP